MWLVLIVFNNILLECTMAEDAVTHYATAPHSTWFQGSCGGQSHAHKPSPTSNALHSVCLVCLLRAWESRRAKGKVHRCDGELMAPEVICNNGGQKSVAKCSSFPVPQSEDPEKTFDMHLTPFLRGSPGRDLQKVTHSFTYLLLLVFLTFPPPSALLSGITSQISYLCPTAPGGNKL